MSSQQMMTLARIHQAELRGAAEREQLARAATASRRPSAEDPAISILHTFASATRQRIAHALVLGRRAPATTPSV